MVTVTFLIVMFDEYDSSLQESMITWKKKKFVWHWNIYWKLLTESWERENLNIYYKDADAIKLEPNLIELLIRKAIFYQELPLLKN